MRKGFISVRPEQGRQQTSIPKAVSKVLKIPVGLYREMVDKGQWAHEAGQQRSGRSSSWGQSRGSCWRQESPDCWRG